MMGLRIFENGANRPLNWSFITTGGNTPAWDTVSHSGARSVKISIPGTGDNKSGYPPQSDLVKAEPLAYYTLCVLHPPCMGQDRGRSGHECACGEGC